MDDAPDSDAYKAERDDIRAVLDAWYGGHDGALVAYVRRIGRPCLLERRQMGLWLSHVERLARREAELTRWLCKVDASCAGEEPWAP